MEKIKEQISSMTTLHWIAFCAVLLAILDTFVKPISLTALGLLVVGGLPWLVHLFRTIELPGGIKLEMKDLQRVTNELEEAGLAIEENSDTEYSFMMLSKADPNLALAGLRIEIERHLQNLAKENNLLARTPNNRPYSVRMIINELTKHEILSSEEASVLNDLLPLLNEAVHGADVTSDASEWAFEVGPRLLSALSRKIGGK